jgi:hypothetical protein
LSEYTREKKEERALLKFDLTECIYKTYTAAQPTEKHKVNKAFEDFEKFREELLKEIFGDKEYEEIKAKHIEEEGKKTWGDLKKSKKGKKKVMF